MRLSISEIINKAETFDKPDEQIQWLKKNANPALRLILKYWYDPTIVFLIPDTAPPWKKNDYIGVEGMLYHEARRIKIFIKGGGYDDLNQVKREALFISMLEDIDNNDAELLCRMISKKHSPKLSFDTVKTAFPEDYK